MEDEKKYVLPVQIQAWLANRGLDPEIIEKFNIGWNGKAITIPILDVDGKFLYFKYRRDPDSTTGPKYWYDTGQQAKIFNSGILKSCQEIIITEGEFDCMLLNSKGFPAISSTGGAGTFYKDWIPLLANKTVYVCMDNDEAGRSAAIKLMFLIPDLRIIILPDEVGEHGDITDYFIKLKKEAINFRLLMAEAVVFPELKEYILS